MGYLLCFVVVFINLFEGIIVKNHTKKHGNGGMLVNALTSFFALIFFIIAEATERAEGVIFTFPKELMPYAFVSVIMYILGFYFTYAAYKIGPFGLTKLIASFSLLFPIIYGLFFLNEGATVFTYIGIVLMFASMVAINLNKKRGDEENKGFSLKWLIFILISATANGMISILTRMQQIKFNDTCSNEFMIISLAGCCISLFLMGFIKEKKNSFDVLRKCAFAGVLTGVLNGLKNFTTILIYLYIPISIASPFKAGAGIVVAFLASMFLYREKYSKIQLLGVLLGTLSIVLIRL